MLATTQAQGAVAGARGAGYDLILLAHVLAALVGFGALAVAGTYALVVARSGAPTEGVVRYYRPGFNWAGRILFLVPVFGVALVVMSEGEWSFGDSWVTAGLVLWTVVALVAELVLWPAERRLQAVVASGTPTESLGSDCRAVALTAVLLCTLLVAAGVMMVAKP